MRNAKRITRHGLTLVETTIVVALGAIALCVSIPVLASVGTMSGDAVSLSNLRLIATAHDAYAKTFGDRQVTWIPDDVGLVNGNCTAYVNTIACPPAFILGIDPNGGLWGYFLGGGLCSAYPGSCANNWSAYKPIEFSGADVSFGSFRLANADAFNNFLDGRFYSDVFYSPNDQAAFQRGAPYRDKNVDFASDAQAIAFSTYCLSPAAMYHPDVLGSAYGGWRNPNTFAEAYASPSVPQCAYPDLKTRMIEHNWTRGSPAWRNAAFAGDEPYYFNASSEACPLSLFYDGHIARLPNTQAIADDETLFQSNGQRLWSRTTPLGPNGYYGAWGADPGPKTSHTILTMDGILGRDVLTTR